MGLTRRRRSVAYVCIAAVLLAALLPCASGFDFTLPEPSWILLAALVTGERPPWADAPAFRSALVPLLPGRAPPAPLPS